MYFGQNVRITTPNRIDGVQRLSWPPRFDLHALLLVVEQAKKSLTESAEVTEQVIERWKARLLQHGPTSDLGRMARHQLRLWEDRKAKTA